VVALGHYRFRVRKTGNAYESALAMAWWFGDDGKNIKFRIYKDSAAEASALRGA
jgi:hypothetical protein